jgi:hypothetical protein
MARGVALAVIVVATFCWLLYLRAHGPKDPTR